MTDEPGGAELPNPAPDLSADTPRLVAESGQLYATSTLDRAAQLMQEDRPVYLTPLYYSEQGVAARLLRIMTAGTDFMPAFAAQQMDWTARFAQIEARTGVRLAPEQRQAVVAALSRRVVILTGGPGTARPLPCNISTYAEPPAIASCWPPTGAAKRLAESAGQEAKTVHRLLDPAGRGPLLQAQRRLSAGRRSAIVDEASMLDMTLANHLLKAVRPACTCSSSAT